MAKYTKAQQEEAIAQLREELHPGDTVFTVLRHVSRSGMMRVVGPCIITHLDHDDGTQEHWHRWIGFLACKALVWPSDNDQGVKVAGCGMDMGFHLVYQLSHVLFGDGYALKQRWI